MRKNWKALACMAMACTMLCGTFAGCGGGESGNSSGAGAQGDSVQAPNKTLGVAEEYLPVVDKITAQAGKIDVVILFDGTEKGWEALEKEYERIHNNQVNVELNTRYTSETYADALNNELGTKTDWDIVQGNLAVGDNTRTYCYNMAAKITSKNEYAGNKTWSEVLEEDAYISDKTGGNTETYLMNSEGLQTAWFYNKTAFDAAVEKGYENADGKADIPITWDDLMYLCACMEDAGYNNPLGVSLNRDSISASQFTWLLRVYGDYYYRNEYDYITNDETYRVDLTSENPEEKSGYSLCNTKIFNMILDEDDVGEYDHYVGGTSDKFQDFLSQFEKMADYLPSDVINISMEEMRADFRSQGKGKNAPQIMLDYAGIGLSYAKSDAIEMDFFDYPIMESEFVEEETLLRDVGGNGGYLSIVTYGHSSEQNNLNIDFMKFVMSPYGQTVYYKGLSEGGGVPKGLTTVVNDYVVIPEEWKTFFATDKISFSGLSDSNPFVSYFLRDLNSEPKSKEKARELWQAFLAGKGNDKISAATFGAQWQDVLMEDWKSFSTNQGWDVNCWKYPGEKETFGG
ncbi:MAG: hypothetical protein IJX30_02995 [Clostridia bacterium]|nr:hypothetical protein [Clostridia bacterium]